MASVFQDTKGTTDLEELLDEVFESDTSVVIIHISDVDAEEKYPDRIITLQHPDWSINIGRGNSTEEALIPSPTNTWFTSRVMSRHHATLKAHPKDRILTITDAGSMHGTYLNGEKVMLGRPDQLLQDDIITFGNQVVRGHEAFPPLKVSVHFDWTEPDQLPRHKPFSNSFTADYSEEDIPSDVSDNDDDDDVVEIVEGPVMQPRIQVIDLDAGDRTPSVLTSPSMSSERRRLSSESDPTSASIVELEDDEEKDYLLEEDEIPEQEQQTREASLESDDYEPSIDEEEEMQELLNAVEARKQNPLTTFINLKASEAMAAARDPSPSDAAMAKPRPASPVRLPSVVPPPPPPPPPPATKFPDPPTSFDAARSSNSFQGYNHPWRQAFNLSPASPVFEPFANPCAGPFGYNVTPETYCYPYPQPQYSVNPPLATQTSLPRVAGLSSSAMPWPSTQFNFHPVSDSGSLGTFSRKRKADELSDYSESDYPEVDEAVSEMDSVDEIPPEPFTAEIPSSTSEANPSPICGASSPIWNSDAPTTAQIPAPTVDTTLTADPEPAPRLTADNTQIDTEVNTVVKEAIAAAVAELVVEAVDELPAQEPPRKKTKVEETIAPHKAEKGFGTARQVVKYAATALAGATVGAIGTVFGLAALPPDFFT
ncbi:hypothetical protein H2198_000904 [Neophaeococcomyces mojaviensis]|uniref:Uncharacterized protein n=1 Tax=Neophaeococcomyces mojaviensis TaxID=3383035 RepID=A0ACC3AJ12_9EURO|nr:hypothetical protein H2198_000904 [Knufia sp. JES_112]